MSTTVLKSPVKSERASLLRNALLTNAVFSTLCALDFIFLTRPISAFLGWSNLWILPLIGVGLLGFSLYVFQVARATKISTSAVKSIIAADVAWIVLSILILATPVVPLTLGGRWGVGIVADVIALFALLQFLGLRRLER